MTSGVQFIPLFLSQMVALIVTGAVVTRWGYYVRSQVDFQCKVAPITITYRSPT